MTNFELLKSFTIEEMAIFLANESYRMAKPLYDIVGYGIHPQMIAARRLEWLESEVSDE